jgi:hypothetical protein
MIKTIEISPVKFEKLIAKKKFLLTNSINLSKLQEEIGMKFSLIALAKTH